jgi:trimeric autotransporter adhesin
VLSQTAGSTYQRLNPGQETWVRAYVTSPNANQAAPAVRVLGYADSTALGEVAMTGPATLPQLAAGASPTNTQRYDITQTFRAQLPADWVASNLRVRVEVDPRNAAGLYTQQEATPAVGSATRLQVVVVPLVSGSNSPQMPTAAQVQTELARALPVAREQITVTLRAPYTLTSVTNGVDTDDDWRNALSELDQLREREAPTKLHYGMVRPMVNAGTSGIGYVNPVNDTRPNLSSLGWDASRNSWPRTMLHELGHNFSREHAPCGGVNDADPAYPYNGGALGSAPLFDSGTDTIVAPGTGTNQYDVMGYCGGRWFSDFNFSFVQQFLEFQRSQGRLSVDAAALNKSAQEPTLLLVVAGTIDHNGARIDSVLADTGVPQTLESGSHTLELRTLSGHSVRVPVSAKRIDHAKDGALHFSARIAHPGALAQLRVLRSGVSLSERGSTVPQKTTADAAPQAQLREAQGSAQLQWSTATHAQATLTHVKDGQRTLLALKLVGGNAQVDTRALPEGGVFEVGLSDGLNTHTLVLPR